MSSRSHTAFGEEEVTGRWTMIQSIRLMIVGDHQLFRQCLASALNKYEKFSVIQLAANPSEAFHTLRVQQPDVVLIDIHLPNNGAIGLTRQISLELPQVKVLVLGLVETETEILKCVEAGASGYVLKEATVDDLRETIDLVIRGETTCSPKIAHHVFSRLSELAHEHWRGQWLESLPLTSRELQILQLIADGLSNRQIAKRLYLSLHTVKNHVHNILEKLQVRRRFQAVEYARAQQWLKKGYQ